MGNPNAGLTSAEPSSYFFELLQEQDGAQRSPLDSIYSNSGKDRSQGNEWFHIESKIFNAIASLRQSLKKQSEVQEDPE